MLTRLKVSGFKNLMDVDVRFEPFTCIAGANGVGKSNLFDAIAFLSALAEKPLMEAALLVRDEEGRQGDLRSLFHRVGESHDPVMTFEAEMVVPPTAVDDLGQPAKASITFLHYDLTLAWKPSDTLRSTGMLEIQHEELRHINIGDARPQLRFDFGKEWQGTAITGRRTSPFISTRLEGEKRIIQRHQEGNSGRPQRYAAETLTRTVLSASNAAESPTALVARREMQSWRLLQLEPSALRKPDAFNAPSRLGADGAHLPATLYRLAHRAGSDKEQVYAEVANRLSELIDDVRRVEVDRDDKRELLTLMVKDQTGTYHPARALSDGTLRFLALAVLERDPETSGLLCLEEPENGIHPLRIPAMLRLLQDIANDTDDAVGQDNPIRQVIVNTHSPAVVQQIPDKSLVLAQPCSRNQGGQYDRIVRFAALPDTWRTRGEEAAPSVSKGDLLAYLNPVLSPDHSGDGQAPASAVSNKQRVIDRPDMRQLRLQFED